MAATTQSELSTALDALKREREHKLREVAEVDRAIEHLAQVIQRLLPGTLPDTPPSDKWAGLSITEAARRHLQEAGPQTTRQICTALLQGGIQTTARNWYMTVYASLRDAQGFERTAEGLWYVPVPGSAGVRPPRR